MLWKTAYSYYMNFKMNSALYLFNKDYCQLNDDEQEIIEAYFSDTICPEWNTIIIDDIETKYEVSNTGLVRNKFTLLSRPIYESSSKYDGISIAVNGISKRLFIHRLVAQAFIPNPDNKPEVNHINADQKFNWYRNLEWVTHQENIQWAIEQGHQVVGINHKNCKNTEEQIREVCKMLEDPNVIISNISKITGVSIKTINHIRFDNGWKHIAKDYNIKVPVRKQGPRYNEVSLKILELICKGKSNNEIRSEFKKSGLSNDYSLKSISDRLYHIRKQLNTNSESFNDYRPTT